MTDVTLYTGYDGDYDDDYQAEAYRDRKAAEGWTECPECGEWLTYDDVCEGVRCRCEEETENEA